jgi:HK97 family phage portal protein
VPVIVAPGDKLIMRNGSVSSLARPSVPFGIFNAGGHVSLSGGSTISYQGLYEEQPWVYVTVNKLARQIARLPLKAYRLKEGTKNDGERERVRDHPLPKLLKSPQPRRGPVWLKQKAAYPALIQGNGLFAKILEQGPGSAVDQLKPLDWRFITPHLTETGELVAWETKQTTDGEPRYFAPDSVIHVAWDAGAGDLGVSPLRALHRTLNIEDSAQRYQAASFNNGVRHSAVYVLPEGVDMDEGDKQELRAAIQSQQGGVDQAFGLALATGGGDIKPLSHTAVEAELIEQRKLDREEVAAVYDIPPPLIGILDHATYSNVAEMHRMLYGMVLGPWLTLIEETLQAQLIDSHEPWREEGLFVEFDLAEVLKGDTLKEVQAIKEGIATGILTPNEGRAIRNMAPSKQDGMDAFYLPTNNMQPVGTGDAPDEPDAMAFAPIKRQIELAANRVHSNHPKGIDPARIERELAADLGDPDAAREWASRIEQAGTPDAIRALIAE